jgi:outer membrane protein
MLTLRRYMVLPLLASTLFLSLSVQAQEFKAGFVNIDRIFREANTAKAAQTKLEQEFSRREKEIIDLGNTLKAASEKFERESTTMSEAQRLTKQRQLVDQDREFQRKRREFQEDLNNRKNEELAMVLDRANKVIKQIAETEVVYFNPKLDITDKIIKTLNATPAK